MELMKRLQIRIRPYKEFLKENLSKVGIKFDTVFIVKGDVDKNRSEIALSAPSATMAIASRDQIEELCIADAKERIGRGDICFLVFSQGKLAGYAWLSVGKHVHIPEIEYELSLAPGEAYQYDALIYPPFRRNNLHKLLIRERLEYLKNNNFKSVYGFISANNIVSLKNVHSCGFEPIKKIRFCRIFWFQKRWEYPVHAGSVV